MSKKTKILLFSLAMFLVFITLVITFSSIFKVSLNEIKEKSIGAKALSISNAVHIGTIQIPTQMSHSVLTSGNGYEVQKEGVNSLDVPNGFYCWYHGRYFAGVGSQTVVFNGTYSEMLAWRDQLEKWGGRNDIHYYGKDDTHYWGDKYIGLDYWYDHSSRQNARLGLVVGNVEEPYCPIANLKDPYFTSTFYQCEGNHPNLPPLSAFIVTSGEGYDVNQLALWMNKGTYINVGEVEPSSGVSGELSNQARDYVKYEEKLNNNKDNLLTDDTKSEPKIDINQTGNYLLIGPYKIHYVDGKYSNGVFAGLSGIIVEGYNDKNKTKKIKDCEILGYIQDGKTYDEIKYYEPTKSNYYVDEPKKCVYPESDKEFYLKIKNPNSGNVSAEGRVNYFKIKVEYKFMRATAQACVLWGGHQYMGRYRCVKHYDQWVSKNEFVHNVGYWECVKNFEFEITKVNQGKFQYMMLILWAKRDLYKLEIELKSPESNPDEFNIELGGNVWEDVSQGKEGLSDGKLGSGDILLPNVKVTLYEYTRDENGTLSSSAKVADLLSSSDKSQLSEEEINSRINPQLTDANGHYEFHGLNPFSKYYVTFEYNGQIYLPTDYSRDLGSYNTVDWEVTSKATETTGDRTAFDNKFAEIGSSPKNYKSSNSLQSGALTSDGYNQAFSISELSGLDGKGQRLIDGREQIDGDGNIIIGDTIQEGLISTKIKEYINTNKKYPDDSALKQIYSSIAGGDKEMWQKLQYIEDCKIKAYTTAPGKASIGSINDLDVYPIYDNFVVNSDQVQYVVGDPTYEYKVIYPGQYYINLGLWRRQQNDLALRKDVYRAAIRINGKTEVYKYNERATGDNELLDGDNLQWNIQLRVSDYNNYYGPLYNREITPFDYNYVPAETNIYGSQLEVYVTYQIVVRNTSMSIVDKVTEVVDYYDKEYTLMPELSWVMYKPEGGSAYEGVSVPKGGPDKESGYYNMMDEKDISKLGVGSYARALGESDNSKYGAESELSLGSTYNAVYITGLKDKALKSGENAYIYLTFKVNSDNNGPAILDNSAQDAKYNFAEINGYQSFYADGTMLPNGVSANSSTVAGLVDIDSVPGNLEAKDIQGDHYEENFEDDTDRARGLRVILQGEDRIISGNVWEDKRTGKVGNAIIGDGVKQNDEIGIQGITVELVEKLENGYEYVWKTTTTDANGNYTFTGFIPGNYYVRFRYGDENTVRANPVSYNGQDFKATLYGKELNGEDFISMDEELYDYEKQDASTKRYSDAKDIWDDLTINNIRRGNSEFVKETYNGRASVNAYSSGPLSNHEAEVLSSPYASNINETYIKELIEKTSMMAQTQMIVAEVEYNRTYTDKESSDYKIQNLDFGLTERPKAQLEIGKKITNIRVTLANGTVLFDAKKSTDNLAWVASKAYNLGKDMQNGKYEEYYGDSSKNRYSYRTEKIDSMLSSMYSNGYNGLAQITMDEEIMHGATIQVEYNLTIKNIGETDYTGKDFYYKGIQSGEIVTTAATTVMDYVANNIQYRDSDNSGWTATSGSSLSSEGLVNDIVAQEASKYNTVIKTSDLGTALKPGDPAVTKELKLTQTITAENTNDDRTYDNIAEIAQTTNTVGRRMAFSTVGNQNPLEAPTEIDTAKSERIVILPPFGNGNFYIIISVAIAAVALLAVGIIVIKKFVLKNK